MCRLCQPKSLFIEYQFLSFFSHYITLYDLLSAQLISKSNTILKLNVRQYIQMLLNSISIIIIYMKNFLFSILFAGLILSALSQNTTTCQPGTTLVNDTCVPLTYIPGCSLHSACGKCIRCEFGFTLDQNNLCTYTNNNNNPQLNCCIKIDEDGSCSQCADGLFLQNSQCFSNPIYGCVVKNGQNCVACGTGYSLHNGKCFFNLNGCQLYNSDGTCNQCNSNISVANGAQYTYVLKNGICILSKVALNSNAACSSTNQFGCATCNNGYHLTLDRKCIANDIGCLVYQNGVCKQCSALNGYIWDQTSNSCQKQNINLVNIQYCMSYTSQSSSGAVCSGCIKGYRLVNNVCQIQSQLHIKIRKQCGNGYYLGSDNKCQANTPTGNLIKQDDGSAPLVKQPGCIYQYGKCQYCSAPFQMVNGKCAISNCRQIQPLTSSSSSSGQSYSCKSCQFPFDLNAKGQCQITNCAKYGQNLCIACINGYHLESGQKCIVNDINCQSYDVDGNCQACISGYVVSSNGNCMKKQSNCLTLTNTTSGFPKCIACVDNYFLNTYNQCQKMDSNCQYYVNGACKACATRYFLYNYICFPYSPGCVQYKGKDCTQCTRNYTLVNGQCFSTKPMGMKLLGTDDHYDFDIYPIDITKSKYYIDNLSPISALGQFIYSSAYDNTYLNPTLVFEDTNFSNSNKANGWKSYYNQSGQYVGFALNLSQSPISFYALQLQFIQNSTIQSFFLQYSLDLNNWIRVTNRFFVKDYLNSDSPNYLKNNGVVTIYFTGVYAQGIRIVVDEYTNWPAARIQFFYYDLLRYQKIANLKSLQYLQEAIQTNYVNRVDNQLYINQNYFFKPQSKCHQNENITCFTGLQLCESKLINKIQVINGGNGQNNSLATNYVSQFYIMYSNDGRSFQCWNNCSHIQMNQNSSTTIINSQYQSLKVNLGVSAKNIRVYPAKWVGQPQISIEYSYE